MVFGKLGVENVKTNVFVGIRVLSFRKEILRTADTSCGASSLRISSSGTPDKSGHRMTPFDELREGCGNVFIFNVENSVNLSILSDIILRWVSMRSWSDLSFFTESTVPIMPLMVFWMTKGESLVIGSLPAASKRRKRGKLGLTLSVSLSESSEVILGIGSVHFRFLSMSVIFVVQQTGSPPASEPNKGALIMEWISNS